MARGHAAEAVPFRHRREWGIWARQFARSSAVTGPCQNRLMASINRGSRGSGSGLDACERCGFSRWIPILYGMPGHEMMDAAERGEIELGGCVIESDAPDRRCRVCGQAPGQPSEWTGLDGPRHGEFGDHHRILVTSEVPDPDAPEPVLLHFALTFDGYDAMGAENLATTARRTRRRFEKGSTLPSNLVVLRSTLFFEQRSAHHSDAPFGGPYVSALIEAIRAAAMDAAQSSHPPPASDVEGQGVASVAEALQYASDVDGCRHAIAPVGMDLEGWSVRTVPERGSALDGHLRPFTRMTGWWSAGSPNLLGYGECLDSWAAVVDWGERMDGLVPPSDNARADA